MFARFFIVSFISTAMPGTLGKSFILLLSLALALCLRLRVFVVWSLPLLLFLFPPHLTPPPTPLPFDFCNQSVHQLSSLLYWCILLISIPTKRVIKQMFPCFLRSRIILIRSSNARKEIQFCYFRLRLISFGLAAKSELVFILQGAGRQGFI